MYILLYIVINFRALMYESDTIRFDETIIELMNFNVIIDTYSMIRYFRKWKMSTYNDNLFQLWIYWIIS